MPDISSQNRADVVCTCARCVAVALWRASHIASHGGNCWRDVLLSRACIAGLKHHVGTCPGRDHGVDRVSEYVEWPWM